MGVLLNSFSPGIGATDQLFVTNHQGKLFQDLKVIQLESHFLQWCVPSRRAAADFRQLGTLYDPFLPEVRERRAEPVDEAQQPDVIRLFFVI